MIMKKLLRKYPETTLAIFALVLLAAIFAYFSWGAGDIVAEINRAANVASTTNGNTGFDMAGAQSLDLKGLVK
jgi:hypothetical protein